MKSTYLVITIAGLGLLSGYAVHRLSSGGNAKDHAPSGPSVPDRKPVDSSLQRKPQVKQPVLSSVRSTDTIETLKAAPPEDLYGRLALWMVDASKEEIAEYWQHFGKQENRPRDIIDLVFVNWSRLDPQGAVNAVAGTSDDHFAWWAWACHDPTGSLAAVMAQDPKQLNNVTWGLGEFHPDWVREHWDEIPKAGQQNALAGMAKWDDVGNPLEVLTFLQEKGFGFHQGIFKVLISKDPWAAYDLVKDGAKPIFNPYGGSDDTFGTFVEAVADQHPEMLEKLASQTPSGELKWKMEAALFDSLLKHDPEAAKQQALNNSAPKVAIDQLTAVGNSLLSSDPDQAFEMAERIFSINPDAMHNWTKVDFGNSNSSWGTQSPELTRLVNALVSKDPARAIKLVVPSDGQNSHNSSLLDITGMWATQDLQGYAEWVNDQADTAHQSQAVGVLINHLTDDQAYDDAAAWAVTVDNPLQRLSHLDQLIHQWGQADPGSAADWIENAGLTADETARLQRRLPSEP